MNQLILFAIIAVFIFVLTYDPKTGKIEKYLQSYSADPATNCADPTFRSQHPGQCKDATYNGVQFAQPQSAFALPTPSNSKMGAIIRQ